MPLEAPVITTVLPCSFPLGLHDARRILGHVDGHRVQLKAGTVSQYQGQVFDGASDAVGKHRFACGVELIINKRLALKPSDSRHQFRAQVVLSVQEKPLKFGVRSRFSTAYRSPGLIPVAVSIIMTSSFGWSWVEKGPQMIVQSK